jgi:hypothetical protein
MKHLELLQEISENGCPLQIHHPQGIHPFKSSEADTSSLNNLLVTHLIRIAVELCRYIRFTARSMGDVSQNAVRMRSTTLPSLAPRFF